jgi:hypothetical protein
MAGCFGNHPIDRWMEGQLNRYLDSQDEPGDFDFDFNFKVQGKGTVKVFCEAIYKTDQDEDGCTSYHIAKIKDLYWSFDKDRNIDIDFPVEIMRKIEYRAEKEMKENIEES